MKMLTRILVAIVLLSCGAMATAAGDVLIKDPEYHLLAKLSPEGVLTDVSGNPVAHFLKGGAIQDGHKHAVGSVDLQGIVKDASGKVLARIREDGAIIGASGHILGFIAKEGLIQGPDYSTEAHAEGEGWNVLQMAAFWFVFRDQLPKLVPRGASAAAALAQDTPGCARG